MNPLPRSHVRIPQKAKLGVKFLAGMYTMWRRFEKSLRVLESRLRARACRARF